MALLTTNHIFAGRYRLLQHIGTGAFAEVWKVEDTMAGNTIFALKVFAPDKGMDSNGIKIFREEYALSHSLQHPHLLKTYHFDIHNGSPYLKMPLCEGGNLMSKIIDKHVFREEDIAQIIAQIGGALAYMHTEKVFHQDIKPENILIYKPNNYVLADFGISRRIRKTILHKGSKSQSEQEYSAFTTAYAPPEKYTDKPSPFGDIFSFGVTLYELIMGDLPFDDMGRAVKEGVIIEDFPIQYSRSLNQLVKGCMNLEKTERPSADQLQHWANYYLKHRYWNIQVELGASSYSYLGKNSGEIQTPTDSTGTEVIEKINPTTIPDLLEKTVQVNLEYSTSDLNDEKGEGFWSGNKKIFAAIGLVFLAVLFLATVLIQRMDSYSVSINDICENSAEIEQLQATAYAEKLLQFYRKHELNPEKWKLLPVGIESNDKWLLPNFGFTDTEGSLSFVCLIGSPKDAKILIFTPREDQPVMNETCKDCWIELVEKGEVVLVEDKGKVLTHSAEHQELKVYRGDTERKLIFNSDNKLSSWTW